MNKKLEYLATHRGPIILNRNTYGDTNHYFTLEMGNKDKTTYHLISDLEFDSLIERAHSIAKTEIESWGY